MKRNLQSHPARTLGRPAQVESNSATALSLEQALQANHELQEEILQQLKEVHDRKCQNRQRAANCVKELNDSWEIQDEQSDKDTTVCSSKPQHVQALLSLTEGESLHRKPPKRITSNKAQQFQYNPSRKWNFEFFMDPLGSRPEPNPDVAKRAKLMHHPQDPSKPLPFYHLSPTWTNKERKIIQQLVNEQRSVNNNGESIDSPSNRSRCIDFEAVARELSKRTLSKKGRDKGLPPTAQPRTANECRLFYESVLVKHDKFTKAESLSILEQVQTSEATGKIPDWNNIATSLSQATTESDGSHTSRRRRTAWECFCHFKQKLEGAKQRISNALASKGTITHSTTLEQDDTLLRYLALQGPQFVWDLQAAADVSSRLFPTHSGQQLLTRSQGSAALNPNLTSQPHWSKEHERRLVLAMKVYHGYDPEARDGSDQADSNNKSVSAIYLASGHFPDRTNQQVSHKWDRSLDPSLDQRPFSAEEDARLKQILLDIPAGQDVPFGEVTRKHFPQRRYHQVYQRWLEISTTEDMVHRYGDTLLWNSRRGLGGGRPRHGGLEEEQEHQLSGKDFRLEPATKK